MKKPPLGKYYVELKIRWVEDEPRTSLLVVDVGGDVELEDLGLVKALKSLLKGPNYNRLTRTYKRRKSVEL